MCGLNIAYMIEQGGIDEMNRKADVRSKMFYDYIDSTDGYYINRVNKKYRSRMNHPFVIKDDRALGTKFCAEAQEQNLKELAGHVSVGGVRASFYNAMPIHGVEALLEFMKKFRADNPWY